MADFVSGFWGPYVSILTILSLVFCLFLLIANSRKPTATADNTTGHVWDEDLKEANNPLPRWWVGLFIITVVFAVLYLAYYPGLGGWGYDRWSSAQRYEDERKDLEARVAPLYEGFKGKSGEQLAGDPKAMAIGERLFLNNCAQCHGSDARGSKGFPNLTDNDWLYGGKFEDIVTTITKGRHGAMPPMAAAVGNAQDVENVAQYVLSLSGSATDPVKAQAGREKFVACAACHGMDGKGNPALGAPNLTDRVWLHQPGLQGVIAMINNGKENQMPEHASKFTEGQINVLAAYVKSLSSAGQQ